MNYAGPLESIICGFPEAWRQGCHAPYCAVLVAFCMIIYMLSFFTISPDGIRLVSLSMVEFFQGAIIPLPFFPDAVRKVMELLPFAAMQNVALRVYSGDLAGAALQRAVILQIFWFFAMLACGKALEYRAMKKIVVQGG